MNYYNEIDPYKAAWLANLMDAGAISRGEIDTRSICDVSASDLRGFRQVHLFAGIGVWSYVLRRAALRLAGPRIRGLDRDAWAGFRQAGFYPQSTTSASGVLVAARATLFGGG